MIDYTKLLEKLAPTSEVGVEPKLRLRVGTVVAVNSNGTLDVAVDEVTVPSVPVLGGILTPVNSAVQILVQQGSMLVIGTVAANADADQSNAFSTTPIQPLVSAASTDALITSVSHTFKAGYGYKISWKWTAQFAGGTSPFAPYSKIRRSNASGTVIDDAGASIGLSTNFMIMVGHTYLKCTVADTTQTIALIGGYSGTGGPTSMDVEAASTRRTSLTVKRVGTAARYSGALEVPTA